MSNEKKHPLVLLLCSMVFVLPAYTQDKDLTALVYSKQYPRLEAYLSSHKVSTEDKMVYEAFLLNAHNKPEASDRLLAQVFRRKLKNGDDTLEFHLRRIAYDNKVKLNAYRSAFAAGELLLKEFGRFFDASALEGQKEESKIWHFLSNVPKQTITKKGTTVLRVKRDLAGLWNIPVSSGDTAYEFVFDTGAGISTIAETYARKLNLKIIAKSAVSVKGGINGISTTAKVGVARQLQIGKQVIQNAVFLVFPDSALSFAGGAYAIKGIIGLPIIKDFGEVTISSEKMTVPKKKSTARVKANMATDLLTPVVYIDFKGVSLPCTFDCGAQTSLFSDNFYNRFKQTIIPSGKYDSAQLGGAGGTRTLALLEVPKLDFAINGAAIQLLQAQVSLEPLPAAKKYYYANIGQDVLAQFEAITINFLTSTLTFRERERRDKK